MGLANDNRSKIIKDITVSVFIEVGIQKESELEERLKQISYILNQACSDIEKWNCNIFYKLKDASTNREIKLDLP